LSPKEKLPIISFGKQRKIHIAATRLTQTETTIPRTANREEKMSTYFVPIPLTHKAQARIMSKGRMEGIAI
jgi:hypothetical protein